MASTRAPRHRSDGGGRGAPTPPGSLVVRLVLVLALAGVTMTSAQAEPTTGGAELRYSASRDYSNALPLDGAALAGWVVIHLVPGSEPISAVTFFLDGREVQREQNPPWTLSGNTDAGPTMLDASQLSPGTHTVTADVTTSQGLVPVTSRFTVADRAVAPPIAGTLSYSKTADYALPLPIEGAAVSGRVAVFLQGGTDIASVAFKFDDQAVVLERYRPYDLNRDSGGRSLMFDTSSVAQGDHVLRATVTLRSGGTYDVSSTFTVGAPTPIPTAPPGPTPTPTTTPEPSTTPTPTPSPTPEPSPDPEPTPTPEPSPTPTPTPTLSPSPAPAPAPRPETRVLGVEGDQFTLDGAPFDMWGIRTASATYTQEQTDHLIAQLDTYKTHGVNTVAVYYMGSRAANYDPFSPDGRSVDEGHQRRMEQILAAADERGMAVVVGIFYQAAPFGLDDAEAVRAAVRTVTTELRPYRNAIINIANEQSSPGWDDSANVFNFRDPNRIIELLREVHSVDPDRLAGGGGYSRANNIVIGRSSESDVLLFDTGLGGTREQLPEYEAFVAAGVTDPAVNVEQFGGYTNGFERGVFDAALRSEYTREITTAAAEAGLYTFFHNGPWLQVKPMRYDLGGAGTAESPGIRWYFEGVQAAR
jgi:outer membrane biosynthesis protein TonB